MLLTARLLFQDNRTLALPRQEDLPTKIDIFEPVLLARLACLQDNGINFEWVGVGGKTHLD